MLLFVSFCIYFQKFHITQTNINRSKATLTRCYLEDSNNTSHSELYDELSNLRTHYEFWEEKKVLEGSFLFTQSQDELTY